MKNVVLALFGFAIVMGCTGCKNTRVVGNTVYQRLSWPSGFGSYQHLIVAYPLGQTNLQQVINSDSVPGPIPSMFGAAVKSAAFVWGAHEMRNIGRSKEDNSVNVSNTGNSSAKGGTGGTSSVGDVTGGSATSTSTSTGGSVGDVTSGGGSGAPVTVNQTVNAPGSNHQRSSGFPHKGGKGW